ncbi:hypothetical protein ZWY2020_015527 [Hordeum vulgare]|nr:hypothetical protein ZWY2020_015527 [Hordeum vulgare]
METLPDDAVMEILLRVTHVRDFFRCAATCKRWWFLVAHPSFLRRRWPDDTHHPSSFLGFFAEQWMDGILVSSFTRAPSSPSLLAPQWRIASSFPDASRVVPLAARRGLLLVRLERGFQESHLAVCGPLTDVNYVLPPLRCNQLFKIRGYAILTGTDFCSNKQRRQSMLSFKVLMIGVTGDTDNPHYSLYAFSSGESSWSVPRKCFDALEHGIKAAPLHANAVVCQGTAHWLFRNKSSFHTLNVSVETGHATLTKISVTPRHLGRNFRDVPRLGVTNGVLSLVAAHRKCLRVKVLTCQGEERSGGNWRHTKTIELQRPKQDRSKIVGSVCVRGAAQCL